MKRTIAVTVTICSAAVLAATAFASSSTQVAAACVAGVKKINGVPARTFCGPAKASVKLGAQTVAYKQGACSKSGSLFTINIGTVVLGNLKNKPEYFGITVKAKAGAQANQGVAVVHAGKSRAILGTVTLKAGLKAGTFSGKVFGAPVKISGSFSC